MITFNEFLFELKNTFLSELNMSDFDSYAKMDGKHSTFATQFESLTNAALRKLAKDTMYKIDGCMFDIDTNYSIKYNLPNNFLAPLSVTLENGSELSINTYTNDIKIYGNGDYSDRPNIYISTNDFLIHFPYIGKLQLIFNSIPIKVKIDEDTKPIDIPESHVEALKFLVSSYMWSTIGQNKKQGYYLNQYNNEVMQINETTLTGILDNDNDDLLYNTPNTLTTINNPFGVNQ